jgi:hypothetical protein
VTQQFNHILAGEVAGYIHGKALSGTLIHHHQQSYTCAVL